LFGTSRHYYTRRGGCDGHTGNDIGGNNTAFVSQECKPNDNYHEHGNETHLANDNRDCFQANDNIEIIFYNVDNHQDNNNYDETGHRNNDKNNNQVHNETNW
jgi:hypothetical protein